MNVIFDNDDNISEQSILKEENCQTYIYDKEFLDEFNNMQSEI